MASVIAKTKPIKTFPDKSTRVVCILFNLKRELSQKEYGKYGSIGMLITPSPRHNR